MEIRLSTFKEDFSLLGLVGGTKSI